jgi:putative ABC transport system substrate-binding protein
VLINPADASNAESQLSALNAAAATLALRLQVLKASSSDEIDAAFALLARERPDALFVGSGAFFLSRRIQLVHLVTRHALVATYSSRDYAVAGGLLTYGTAVTDAYHQVGVYAGRILKGVKPAELPVMQSTKFELVINRQTAKTLGIDVPPTLLARADEVIE